MRRLLPVLVLSLLALPALAQRAPRNWANAACEDDLDSCRENCTIADGTSLDTQGRLARCSQKCQEDSERCIFKRFQARRALNLPKPADTPPPAAAFRTTTAAATATSPATTASTASGASAAPAGSRSEDRSYMGMGTGTGMGPGSAAAKPTPPSSAEDDAWSDIPATPPPAPVASPAASSSPRPQTPAQTWTPRPSEPPAPSDDGVDALLDKPAPVASGTSSKPPPKEDGADPTKLAPQKKDLSKWDPGALE